MTGFYLSMSFDPEIPFGEMYPEEINKDVNRE